MAASTWMALVTTTVDCPPGKPWESVVVTGRSRAEMMPVVTVEDSPRGLPTAMTS